MTCKDCLSEIVCAMSPIREKYSDINIEKICEHFKNKSDFVEVVRCKDCENFRDCNICIFHSEDDYTFSTEPNDFCSYGERRTTR